MIGKAENWGSECGFGAPRAGAVAEDSKQRNGMFENPLG